MPSSESYILAVELSHKTATVDLREKLAVNDEELAHILKCISGVSNVKENILLSTCNRIELYLAVDSNEDSVASEAAACLCDLKGTSYKEISQLLTIYRDEEVVRHLFRVASGLESMIPGENEVLSQVKSAYKAAKQAEQCGHKLDYLFQRALHVAKEVRSATGISKRRVSIASIAVDIAKRVFGELNDTSVALLGAGNIAELTVKSLIEAKAKLDIVASRSLSSAEKLAKRYGVDAITFDDICSESLKSDVIITSAAAQKPILSQDILQKIVAPRRGKPMLVIDLGVPRNVESGASNLEDVILYNIDDFKSVVDANIEYRLGQVDEASKIIETQIEHYRNKTKNSDASEDIRNLTDSINDIGREELSRSLTKMSNVDNLVRNEVEQMVHRIVGRALHTSIEQLKMRE